jgi:FtsP/CotA-like multicopper oxidase with cupredoxin domain
MSPSTLVVSAMILAFGTLVGAEAKPKSRLSAQQMATGADCGDTLPVLGVSPKILRGQQETIRVTAPARVRIGATSCKGKQVGGYDVSGAKVFAFGKSAGSYAPWVLRTKPGQNIKFKLINELPFEPNKVGEHTFPSDTNIHTHGLVVSPCQHKGAQGDNSLITLQAVGSAHSATTHMGASHLPESGCGQNQIEIVNAVSTKEPASVLYDIPIERDHEPGLFWYHPHIHEQSESHVLLGLSGLLVVGSICDHGVATKASGYLEPAERDKLCANGKLKGKERLIVLKDAQISDIVVAKAGATPTAKMMSYNKELCAALPSSNGAVDTVVLLNAFAKNQGGCNGSGGRWLFTLNGSEYPTIRTGGEQEIWRIANTSADVIYDLSIIDVTGGARTLDDRRQSFQILSVDGAYLQGPSQDKRVFLTPGGRVEISVASLPDGQFELVQNQVATGTIAGEGDTWPAVSLARVDTRKAKDMPLIQLKPGPSAVAALSSPTAGRTYRRTDVEKWCGKKSTVVLVDGTVLSSDDSITKTSDGPIDVRLNNYKKAGLEFFEMQTGTAPAARFVMDRVDLCIEKGAQVKFDIFNPSKEIHNFHMHQVRFEVLSFPLQNAVANIRDSMVGFKTTVAAGDNSQTPRPVMHDVVPVLPGSLPTQISAKFTKTGQFLYHCHILEHEDKGMMSMANVFEFPAEKPLR